MIDLSGRMSKHGDRGIRRESLEVVDTKSGWCASLLVVWMLRISPGVLFNPSFLGGAGWHAVRFGAVVLWGLRLRLDRSVG